MPDIQPEAIELTAEILSTPSSDAPARVETRVTNTGTEEITLGVGPGLVFSNQTDNQALVLDPTADVGLWSEPEYSDGCWRFPADGKQSENMIQEFRTLGPSGGLTATYDVYTREGIEPCFPEGIQQFTETVTVRDAETTVGFTLTVDITPEHTLTIDAEDTSAQVNPPN